jgi:hypothetical protein
MVFVIDNNTLLQACLAGEFIGHQQRDSTETPLRVRQVLLRLQYQSLSVVRRRVKHH